MEDPSYLKKSLNQMVLGNYTDDATLLGTAGQIGLGLAGLDLPGDIRDLTYDLTHPGTPWTQTALDAIGLLPLIGSVKYFGDAAKLAKKAENGAEAIGEINKGLKAAKNAANVAEALAEGAGDVAKGAGTS